MRRRVRHEMLGCMLAAFMTVGTLPVEMLPGMYQNVYAQDVETEDSTNQETVQCQLVLNSQKLTPGTVFTIDVNLLTNPGVTLEDGILTYDENVLELQTDELNKYKVVSHDLFHIDGASEEPTNDFVSPIPHKGEVRLIDGYSTSKQNSKATGTMFTLTFKVKEEVPVDTTSTISYTGKLNGYITDSEMSEYITECQDLSFTVEAVPEPDDAEITPPEDDTPPVDDSLITDSGFCYQFLEDGTIEITGYSGTAYVITIPDTIEGIAVTGIGKNAFFGSGSLTEIYLPDSITTIGAGAFYDCSGLKKIKLSKKIKEVYSYNGGGAVEESSLISNPFVGCSSLEKIELAYDDDSYLQAADGILYRLYSTGEIELLAYPANKQNKTYSVIEGINIIGADAFNGVSSLNEIMIPEGVTRISKGAFANCANLEKIDLPVSLTTIEDGAFDSSQNVVFYVSAGSDAETYANAHGFSIERKLIYGDADGNGEISLVDSALIRRFLAGWNVTIDEEAADVDGDGEISITDSALIRRSLAGWDVTFRE